MKKTLFIIILYISYGVSLAPAISLDQIEVRDSNVKLANSLLFHVKYDLKLLKFCKENYPKEIDLIFKVEESLFRKMSEISSISPLIDELGGTPLNVVVEIINDQENNKFSYSGPYNSKVVDDYLELILNSLIEQREKYERLPTTPLIQFYKHHGQ